MSEGGAVCASHSQQASVTTCSRCGRFSCEACAKASPCLECQLPRREACRPLSPVYDWIIGICAALYAICTVLMVPAMAQFDWMRLDAKAIWSAPMLVILVFETIYSGVWTVLAAAYLIWFAVLID